MSDLVYGPAPGFEELGSGARVGSKLTREGKAVVDAALGCLAKGEAFEADLKLSTALREAIAEQRGYGFTVPDEYGGADGDYGALAVVEEELAANGLGALAVEVSGELTIGAAHCSPTGTRSRRARSCPCSARGA